MKLLTTIGFLAGLAVATLLVAWQGFGDVGTALLALGAGVLLLPLAYLPHLVLNTVAWRRLFRSKRVPAFGTALRAIWFGTSVDALLPTASIGGEVVKARLLMQSGTAGVDAGASVVVDKTAQAISIVLLALIGVVMLLALRAERDIVVAAFAAAILLAAGIAGFILVQHAGSFGFFARLLGRARPGGTAGGLVDDAVALDDVIRALYRAPGRIIGASLLHLAARLALTLEVWLAAYLMGYPLTLLEVVMLKSLTGALSGAAFVVPGGWGVQEGGFVLLGGLIGLTPEFALALSLATRVRELLISLPGLIAWQHAEGRWLWKRNASGQR